MSWEQGVGGKLIVLFLLQQRMRLLEPAHSSWYNVYILKKKKKKNKKKKKKKKKKRNFTLTLISPISKNSYMLFCSCVFQSF